MPHSYVLLLAFVIGIIAGLRSLTAPAVVAWAAQRGWLNLHGTSLSFMGSTAAVAIFTVLAVVELVADQLPCTPARTKPPGLIARILLGGPLRRVHCACWRAVSRCWCVPGRGRGRGGSV